MQQENVPNYIAYALILITATHLGCKVEMQDTAKEVWRTKKLPDTPLLGLYQQAAAKAIETIEEKRLTEKANRLAEVYYITGEFPDDRPVKRYKDYLSMYVLYNSLGDCTAGGVSSQGHDFQVFAPWLSFAQVVNHCLEEGTDLNQVLKLVYRENLDYIHAEPVVMRGKHYMAGGNFIYTSDSRFKELTGIRYPVSIHDRTEE